MTVDQAGGTGSDQSAGGGTASGTGTSSDGASSSSSAGQTVPKSELEKALNDLHRFKAAAKERDDQVRSLTATLEDLKTKQQTANKDYESLYVSEKTKREELEASNKKLLSNVVATERHRAAYPALKKAGLRDDAENLIDAMDLTTIEIEATSSGRWMANGVDPFVEAAKLKYPYAFQKPNAPHVHGSTGSGIVVGATWSPDKLFVLEQECKKKGDMAPWRAAVAEWQKQGKPK